MAALFIWSYNETCRVAFPSFEMKSHSFNGNTLLLLLVPSKGGAQRESFLCGKGEISKITFLEEISAWSYLQNVSKIGKFGVAVVTRRGKKRLPGLQGWGHGSGIKSLQCKCQDQNSDSWSPCKSRAGMATPWNPSTLEEDGWCMLGS